MSFLMRAAKASDIDDLYDVSRQFTLLNLPADKKTLEEIVHTSTASFAHEKTKSQSSYLFVAEDTERKRVVATSLIHGQCGTEDSPNYSYRVLKRDLFSRSLAIGFIHQVLRLIENTNGPSEIGGLLVDRSYRGRPERLGRQISFIRFCYIQSFRHLFTDQLHVEFAPPLTDEGRSEFWEALGRRFTGLPYQEADSLSNQNKEFIKSLFPQEDLFLTLLDSRARMVLGRVSNETRPAQIMLESIGFRYIDEVDPFDGGPHYRAETDQVDPIARGGLFCVSDREPQNLQDGVIGFSSEEHLYAGGRVSYEVDELSGKIHISSIDRKKFFIQTGQEVSVCPLNTNRSLREG